MANGHGGRRRGAGNVSGSNRAYRLIKHNKIKGINAQEIADMLEIPIPVRPIKPLGVNHRVDDNIPEPLKHVADVALATIIDVMINPTRHSGPRLTAALA